MRGLRVFPAKWVLSKNSRFSLLIGDVVDMGCENYEITYCPMPFTKERAGTTQTKTHNFWKIKYCCLNYKYEHIGTLKYYINKKFFSEKYNLL